MGGIGVALIMVINASISIAYHQDINLKMHTIIKKKRKLISKKKLMRKETDYFLKINQVLYFSFRSISHLWGLPQVERRQKTQQISRNREEESRRREEEQKQRTAKNRKGTLHTRSNSFCWRLISSWWVRAIRDRRRRVVNVIREGWKALLRWEWRWIVREGRGIKIRTRRVNSIWKINCMIYNIIVHKSNPYNHLFML